ncbi:11050_t:CDS:2 [Dentiscutata erythropus]|uniref:11050_t:CDS:1 n=1 Tax=Dentiscutata erythropus TaxID=1348616 RepID=A0A9N8ZDM6_9GLOM|nr:11050_t:CDS:2 [Dentiscutata erythropus]
MLFCLVLGDAVKNAFMIDINKDMTISHLKNLIKEKKKNTFQNVDADDLVLWKITAISINKETMKMKICIDINIEKELGGTRLLPSEAIKDHFKELESKDIQIIIQPSTIASLSIDNIINAGLKMEKVNSPSVTMDKYIERPHLRYFIQDRLENNIDAFMRESCCPNDYQGISISENNFKVIYIFFQINHFIVDFEKRPEPNPTTKCYPHILEHEELVSQYLALLISTYCLARNSAMNLQTVLLAIWHFCQISKQSKLLILLQLDEYQHDQYLLTVILWFISSLNCDKNIKQLDALIVSICTGTALTKIEKPGDPEHLNITDYKVYDIPISLMDIEALLDFIDSVIEYKTNKFNLISHENPLYHILIGAV